MRNNLNREKFGAAILPVIDPTIDHLVSWVTALAGLREGAEFLKWARKF